MAVFAFLDGHPSNIDLPSIERSQGIGGDSFLEFCAVAERTRQAFGLGWTHAAFFSIVTCCRS
jgi:hypothetical protein